VSDGRGERTGSLKGTGGATAEVWMNDPLSGWNDGSAKDAIVGFTSNLW
jgi:hypothetical protein